MFAAKLLLLLHTLSASALLEVRLPPPHDLISFPLSSSSRPAVPSTREEETGVTPCSFVSEGPPGTLARCDIEAATQAVIGKHVLPTATVLEGAIRERYARVSRALPAAGARYGTTSCFIASLQNNSGRMVSIDPDARTWLAYELNRQSHHCLSWFVRGTVSADIESQFVVVPGSGGYATRTRLAPAVAEDGSAVSKSHFSLTEISAITGLVFDTLGASSPIAAIIRSPRC
jgi:hypothetical protein